MLKATHGIIKKSTPPAVLALDGAIEFNGTDTSNLSIGNDTNLAVGTSQFTIEWYQYQTDSMSWPRIFAIGTVPGSNSIGVSIESGIFYFWINGSPYSFGSAMSTSVYKNKWVHFAVSRDVSNNIRVFRDGSQLGSTVVNNYNFNNTSTALRIGNETITSTNSSYGGWLSNFRWVKGTALYTANFNRPLTPLTNVAGTELLLLATTNGTVTTDSSSRARTVTANNVTWQAFSSTMV